MHYLWTYEETITKLQNIQTTNRAKVVVPAANDKQDQDVMSRLLCIGDDMFAQEENTIILVYWFVCAYIIPVMIVVRGVRRTLHCTSTLHETVFQQLPVEMELDPFLSCKMLMISKICGHYNELLVETEPDYVATCWTNKMKKRLFALYEFKSKCFLATEVPMLYAVNYLLEMQLLQPRDWKFN